MKRKSLLILLAYLTIYLVWGSTYFFIKMAVKTIPPFYVIGFRWCCGGLFLLALAVCGGRLKTRPTPKVIGSALILGFLLLIGGNGLITVAEQKVDSYLAALILAATPIAIAVFDRLLFKKGIRPAQSGGIFLGILGVAALLYDGKSVLGSITPDILLVLLGMTFWSLATSLGHRMEQYDDSFVSSGLQMLFAGIVSLGWAIYQNPHPDFSAFSGPSWFGLFYLTVLGSLAFCAFNYLLLHEPAIRISTYAFVNPLIAVILGLLLGSETPAPFLAVGFPLILAGLFLMLYGETLWGRLKLLKSRGRSAEHT
jgi:drug/metabolite transporter (DMT)-like permease